MLSYLDYHDAVQTKQQENTRYYDTATVRFGTSVVLSMKGGVQPIQRCDTKGSDFQAVREGYISVTAISILPPVHTASQTKLELLSKGESCG